MIAIVQIQARRFKAEEKTTHEYLENLLPAYGCCWDVDTIFLAEARNRPPIGDMMPMHEDTQFVKDSVGLEFCSVGDWADGYTDFFEYERSMVGLDDLVDPFLKRISEDIAKIKPDQEKVSILTFWAGDYRMYHDGDSELDWDYRGVIKEFVV